MKTVQLSGAGVLRVQEKPVPEPGPSEALVRVSTVGICGSDLHWFEEGGIGDAKLTAPLVLGHEFSGVIESSKGRGMRVAVDPAIPCGVCELCLQGNPNLCESVRFAGHGKQDGALQEFIAWPEHCLFQLPDSLSDADGAMLEPLGVALHSLNLAGLRPGMSVGVYGCGPIGLLIVQLCRLSGATEIYATDPLEHRRIAAESYGVTAAYLANGEESDRISMATHRRGVDVAFEVAGSNAAIDTAMATTRPGGKVILVGIPSEDRTIFTASTARRKGLTIKMVRRMKHTYPTAIRLVESGRIDVRSLVTDCFSFGEAEQAFQTARRREGLKITIQVNG